MNCMHVLHNGAELAHVLCHDAKLPYLGMSSFMMQNCLT